ncbi:MAG: homocysteine S-methyltransferase family protein [Chloroflexi bacterium]|nr:homocysteine S-methyltransferase family protein [Chloroflexota bacterium]
MLPVTSPDVNLVRLLAGTSQDERRPPTRPGPEREWYLPAHARQPNATRERMSAQVSAGADLLLAHTFLTHRRALARVGEARRARELTHSAVVLAREAAEQGRDRRDQELPWAKLPVSVAGALPVLGDDPGSGQLGPLDVAVARDLHDHAGLLADAGVDLIVVEGPRTSAETAAGVRAGRSMGIETWAVIDDHGLVTDPEDLGTPDAILLSHTSAASVADRSSLPTLWDRPHGVMVDALFDGSADGDVSALRDLLAAGASVLGIGDGATPDRLAILRAAIEAHAREQAAEHDARTATWEEWVVQGAARAPRGPASWLSASPPRHLPEGWDWMVVPPDALASLPADRYRLLVSEEAHVDQTVEADSGAIARCLEPGGVAVLRSAGGRPLAEPLRIVDRRDQDDLSWFICRREDR